MIVLASNVRTDVAEAVRNLIQDGISRGKINAYYKLGRRPVKDLKASY